MFVFTSVIVIGFYREQMEYVDKLIVYDCKDAWNIFIGFLA
ncbi:hypothetical protein [Labilibaculum sp.]